MSISILSAVRNILLSIIVVGVFWHALDSSLIHRSISAHVLFFQQLPDQVCLQRVCMTSAERDHLLSVQTRIKLIYLTLITLTLIIKFYPKANLQLKINKTILAIIVCTLLILTTNFRLVFELLHYIFFPEGNWSFPADCILIQTYPLHKWLLATVGVIAIAVVFELKKHLTIWRP